MSCKMYGSRNLLRSAKGHDTDAQADEQGLEDNQAYSEILEDKKGSKVTSKRCTFNFRGRADRVLE